MVKRGNLVLLALSLVLALVTTLVIVRELTPAKNTAANTSAIPMQQVVVVKQDLQAHQAITSADVTTIEVPTRALQPGAATQVSQVVGQFTMTTWFQGQQVISGMYGTAQATSFAASIPAGYRAFTIPDSTLNGVDHLVLPGEYVDLLITGPTTGKSGVLMSDLRVLYVDQIQASAGSATGKPQTSGADTMTLAVTLQQAQVLSELEGSAQIRMLLRSPTEH